MTYKNILSSIIGGFIAVSLLLLFEYLHYLNLGFYGGYVVLTIVLLTMILSLIIDYKWSKKSTFIKRALICFITYTILIFWRSFSEFNLNFLEAFFIVLGLGISAILALIFKY